MWQASSAASSGSGSWTESRARLAGPYLTYGEVMTASTRRRPLTAALGCLGVLLAAVFVATWSTAGGTTAGSAWTIVPSDEVARVRVADVAPHLGALPRLGSAAARVAVPPSAELGAWVGGYVVLAALVGGLLAASGPRPLRPRVGSKQHGTRAPPPWPARVG